MNAYALGRALRPRPTPAGPVIDYPDRPAWPWSRIIGVPVAALLIWCALASPLHDPLVAAPAPPRPRLVTVEGYEWKNDRPDTSRVWTWTVPEDSVTVTATFAVVDDDTLRLLGTYPELHRYWRIHIANKEK